MERQFQLEIEKLKTRIIKMGSLVGEQVELVINAIEEDNRGIIQKIEERDREVNKHERKIEKFCQKIIALNQPVAMDLRLIMSALTISTNLERIGDLSKNIASSFAELEKKPEFISETKHFEMAKIAIEMLRDAIDAFNERNIELAKNVIKTDDVQDDLYVANRRILIEAMKAGNVSIEEAVILLEISRQLERISDQSTNIAEDVYFIVEAQLIKHKYEKYIYSELNKDEENEGGEVEK